MKASMALYAAKQYSYAFIVLKNVRVNFSIGQLVYNFLRKDFSSLLENINKIMLLSTRDELDQHELNEWIITFEISRIFSIVLDFIQSGNKRTFELIYDILDKILFIAYNDNLVLSWYVDKIIKNNLIYIPRNFVVCFITIASRKSNYRKIYSTS
jgi:hypothetical protein